MKSIFTLFILFMGSVYAQTSQLDLAFGNQGKAVEYFSTHLSNPIQILKLENGKFLLLSCKYISKSGSVSNFSFYFTRYHSNGQIDTTFGTNGFLDFSLTAGNLYPSLEMIKMSNKKIMAMCNHGGTTKLLQFTLNGDLDTSFGQNGNLTLAIDGFCKILQTNDGKFILVGQHFDGTNNMYQFARLFTNGTLDTTYGTNGIKISDPTNYQFDLINSVKKTADDKILIAGLSYNQMTDAKAVVSKFSALGIIDTSFGTNGVVLLNLTTQGNSGELKDISLQSNGKIIVCGDAKFPGGTGGYYGTTPILAQLNSNGTMDMQFGTNGVRYFSSQFQANDSFSTITIDENNRIWIGGNTALPFPHMKVYYYLRLFNSKGQDDVTFGNNGVLNLNLSNTSPDFTNYIKKLVVIDQNYYGVGLSSINKDLNHTTTFFKLNTAVLNTEQRLKEDYFKIYPNPVNDLLYIHLKDAEAQITLFDMSGKKLFSDIHQSPENFVMDMSPYSKGMYLMEIKFKDGSFTEKIIKK